MFFLKYLPQTKKKRKKGRKKEKLLCRFGEDQGLLGRPLIVAVTPLLSGRWQFLFLQILPRWKWKLKVKFKTKKWKWKKGKWKRSWSQWRRSSVAGRNFFSKFFPTDNPFSVFSSWSRVLCLILDCVAHKSREGGWTMLMMLQMRKIKGGSCWQVSHLGKQSKFNHFH